MSFQNTKLVSELNNAFDDLARSLIALKAQSSTIADAAALMIGALKQGGKVMFCGNGGSAADSQHLAAELMGRYLKDRMPLAALALTVDTSALTAIGNDYGYDKIFSRQLAGVGRSGDVLVALSTSGNSANVIAAIEMAREMGISSIGMTGADGGAMASRCDLTICAPATVTNRIQEMHIAIGHALCGAIESHLC